MLKKEAAGDDFLKRPKFDLKMEALIPVLKKEIPLKAHVHRADDICTAIRIAKEFDVLLTLEHVTEGRSVVKELAAAGYPVTLGPSLYHATKVETANMSFETAGVLQKAGLAVSITCDAPVTPPEYLPVCASLAVRSGMDPFAALKGITITAARHIGVADRVGSLEVGKDGDVVIADGDILSSTTKVLSVFVDGEKVVG
jgi:imidazolonepropionase-like amidohydrolase